MTDRKPATTNVVRQKMASQKLNCKPNISFKKDILPLFNDTDQSHMLKVTNKKLDLHDYDDVVVYASKILEKVQSGDMPPFPAPQWPQTQVDLFACWIQQGTKP
jgi:hypothetical protein